MRTPLIDVMYEATLAVLLQSMVVEVLYVSGVD